MYHDRTIKVEFEDYLLYDTLNALAAEYATTANHLVNAAVRRLVSDIEFVRELRINGIKNPHHLGERT